MGHARTPRNQIQETAFLVQIVLKLRVLVLNFGVRSPGDTDDAIRLCAQRALQLLRCRVR
eukprot:333914-Rhodomonas_salina.1